MISFQQLAQAAHEAFIASLFAPNPLKARTWAQLPPVEQAAWVASVQAVVAKLEAVH